MSTAKHDRQPLILVYTGDGKGKTSAAVGQALRCLGQGLRVCFIQFVKAETGSGEIKALRSWEPQIEIHVTGCGFSWQNDPAIVAAHGRRGWRLARQKIASRDYDLVILDEVTYLVTWGIVPESELLAFFDRLEAPPHLVLTGRGASPGLVARADLVTEMRPVKHHLQAGIPAQAGIEF